MGYTIAFNREIVGQASCSNFSWLESGNITTNLCNRSLQKPASNSLFRIGRPIVCRVVMCVVHYQPDSLVGSVCALNIQPDPTKKIKTFIVWQWLRDSLASVQIVGRFVPCWVCWVACWNTPLSRQVWWPMQCSVIIHWYKFVVKSNEFCLNSVLWMNTGAEKNLKTYIIVSIQLQTLFSCG